MSVFDRVNRPKLQRDVLEGRVDPDTLLPDVVEYTEAFYYNLFENVETQAHAAVPVSRRGNKQYALRQSFKKADLVKILKKADISEERPDGTYTRFLFLTLTFDHKRFRRDRANFMVTSRGRAVPRFFARLEKHLDGGYSKVIVKESTKSGYPAAHIILYLHTPVKVFHHRKSNSYRLDPSHPYTRSVLAQLKNLDNWNSPGPAWPHGFIDVVGLTDEDMHVKGYSNPVSYVAKYITKSLDLSDLDDLGSYSRVSELPEKYRTRVWTILNSLLWNFQTWTISKEFREDLRKIEAEKASACGGSRWRLVRTVGLDDPWLYFWKGDPWEAAVDKAGRHKPWRRGRGRAGAGLSSPRAPV